jgi:dTDP-4-amino-4,6-dideoxygalactose transaminase
MIPFNEASLVGHEIENVLEALKRGHISGDGPFTKKCHAMLEEVVGGKALLTTSCTHALEMTALLLDLEPGDEFIVPSFTFVSTVNAFVLRGARPVFVDVRPDTLNLDERLLARRLNPRVKAIVPVHYAGVGCEMDEIMRVADEHGVPVIEDNAHGLFGRYRGRALGSFGTFSTLSFHETKNISCGEGGALIINDAKYLARAEILREKGTNRSAFFRGQIDKYGWVDVGSSFLPSEILAAFLHAQLSAYEAVQTKRRQVWERYAERLALWAQRRDVRLPHVPPHSAHPYHMFYLLMRSLEQRQAFIAHMKARGVQTVFHYLPLHLSEMGKRFGGRAGDCPVTEDVSDRLVRLPLYVGLTDGEQETILDAVHAFSG